MISIRAALIVGVAGACFATGWQVSTWRNDSIMAEQHRLEEDRKAENRRLMQQVARQTREAIGQIRIENRNIYQETRQEVIRDPIYVDCVVPADGSRMLNQSREAANNRLGAAGAVPADPDDSDSG